MAEGWGGDPGHSGTKPMMGLQGGMAAPNTQAPSDQSTNYMNARGQSDDPWVGWDSTSLEKGHPTNGGGGMYDAPSDY